MNLHLLFELGQVRRLAVRPLEQRLTLAPPARNASRLDLPAFKSRDTVRLRTNKKNSSRVLLVILVEEWSVKVQAERGSHRRRHSTRPKRQLEHRRQVVSWCGALFGGPAYGQG